MTGEDHQPADPEPGEPSPSGEERAAPSSGSAAQASTQDAWTQVTSEFAELGTRVRTFFARGQGDSETGAQAQEAIQEFVAAAERAGRSIGAALRDDEVQTQAKSAVASLIEAIGASTRDITDRFANVRDEPDDQP